MITRECIFFILRILIIYFSDWFLQRAVRTTAPCWSIRAHLFIKCCDASAHMQSARPGSLHRSARRKERSVLWHLWRFFFALRSFESAEFFSGGLRDPLDPSSSARDSLSL